MTVVLKIILFFLGVALLAQVGGFDLRALQAPPSARNPSTFEMGRYAPR